MEYLDIVDEQGQPTGEIVSRILAHTKGIRHRTAHIWIVRRENEHFQVLMQKRAMSKDSFPGKYDTSSAGHIQAGDEPLASGLRELAEELGIHAKPEDLEFAGCIHGNFAEENLPGQRNCLCLYLSAACRYRNTRPAKRGGGIGAVV